MTTTSPRTPEGTPAAHEDVEAQIARLRAEQEATQDRHRQAVILYEVGHLMQFGLRNEAMAVREFLGAYNLDPQFRPSLIALVQIFERRRSTKNLSRLYDAESRSATTPREAASAQADRAVLMADQLGNPTEARPLLESALEQAAEAQDIALLLEFQLLSEGDIDAALRIIETRADLVRDPVLATLLRLEIAKAKEDDGDVEGALSVLRSAVSTPAARWRVLDQLERVARKAERFPELVVALEGLAKLAAAVARGEDQGQASGSFSVQRFLDRERAASSAAALYREAGHLRRTELNDPAAAVRNYDEAIKQRSDDALLRYERMLACELAGDLDQAAQEAKRILDDGLQGPVAGALHFRLAEHAQSEGDVEAATASMRAALAADADSAVAAAMLDDLLRGSGALDATVDQLDARGMAVEGQARSERLFEAAELAATHLQDAERAAALYTQAAAASDAPERVFRESFAAALRLGDAETANTAATALLAGEIDDEERSALLRDMFELQRLVIEDEEAAEAILEKALATPAAKSWAPDLARLWGAQRKNPSLLARAHRASAERANDAETGAAHLAAAARAYARSGKDEAAVEALRSALERSPTHPYATALLEEVLRARGDAEEVVRLLREAAEKSTAPGAATTQLLVAGAAAEAGDNIDEAISTYERAAERDPTALAPFLALRRLAEGRNDQALLLRALEGLSQREIAAGEPGRHTLALGEHYDLFSGKPELAEGPLRTALGSETIALHAAVDLVLLPMTKTDRVARLDGLDVLLDNISVEARVGVLREAAGTALAGKTDIAKASALLAELREKAPTDRWTPIATLRLLADDRSEGGGDRGESWMSLGRSTDDPEVAAELLLAGLRAQVYGRGEEAVDDAVILAHDVMAVAPDSLAAAVALDETLSAGDDPDGRADALGSWRGHARPNTEMESAHGRALAAAGRSREALETLLRVAVREGEDLASWESIRVCARDCEAWEPLVEACDRLAHVLEDDPDIEAMLLEESAAILMDELKQDARAERRLRRALAIDARRPIAYGRLHDLLAERGDDTGLLELVSARIDLVDEPSELVKLFYEQSRLLRSLSLREDALSALDNLLMLESDHVGGLALLVELQVQQENFEGAVEALQTLAAAEDVPGSQRRIARLGAADFLETKLGNPEAALAELNSIDELGLADRQIYERMASVAESLGRFDETVEAIAAAVTASNAPATIAALERRAGAVHAIHRADKAAATISYGRALGAVPTDLKAGEALAALLEPNQRVILSTTFETAVRAELQADPTNPDNLRKLARAAAWREDKDLELAVLTAICTLGMGNDEERSAYNVHGPNLVRAIPSASVGAAGLQHVRADGDAEPVLPIAAAIGESVAEMDSLEPSGFSIGRGDLVKDTTNALRLELHALTTMWGIDQCELFVGGDQPDRIDVMPYYKGKLAWVCGPGVRSPLGPDQRFTVGLLASGAALGVGPLVRRGPQGAATAVFAALAAAEIKLPVGVGRADMEETTRRVYKAMPRRVRKSLPLMAQSITDGGRAIDIWAFYVTRTAHHAGAISANDLSTALRRVLGTVPTRELVQDDDEAREMLLFWLSLDTIALRRNLGLST